MSTWMMRVRQVIVGLMTACLALPLALADDPRDREPLMKLQDLSLTMAAPTIAPKAGNYPGSVHVHISHPAADAVIYYSLDGSEATDKSIRYHQPFWLTTSATVKARAYRRGHHGPLVASVYGITAGEKVAAPAIAPLPAEGQKFTGSVKVTLSTTTPDAIIYYTLDGSAISHLSPRYAGAIWLSSHALVRTQAFKQGLAPSDESKAPFIVDFGNKAPEVEITPNGGNFDNSVKVTIAPKAAPAPTPTPTPTPEPPSNEPVVLMWEAETGNGVVLTAPMAAVDQDGASQGKVIMTSTAEQGTAIYTVSVAKADTYYLLGRIIAESASADTFFVKIDSGAEHAYSVADGVYNTTVRWTAMKDGADRRAFDLTAGTHTITIRGGEAETILDCLALTNDASFNPGTSVMGMGMGLMAEGNAPTAPVGDLLIVYTLDGLDPTPYSLQYTGPVTLSAGAVVKARAISVGSSYGPVKRSEPFVIRVTPTRLIATVTNRKTDAAIKGATVTVRLPGGREVGKAVTDAEGVATVDIAAGAFGNESDRTLQVIVSATGFVEVSKRVLVQKGADNTVALDLEPSDQPPSTKVAVTVLAEDTNKPIAKAKVQIVRQGASTVTAETDAMGVATLILPPRKTPSPMPTPTPSPAPQPDPSNETVKLHVTAKGYLPLNEDKLLHVGMENAIKVLLKPVKGEPVTKLVVSAKDEVTKAAVAGAEVILETGGGRTVKGATDAQGMATLVLPAGGQVQHLPEMAVRLLINAANYKPYAQDIAIRLGQSNEHAALLKPLSGGLTKVVIAVTAEATTQPVSGAICKVKLGDGPEFAALSDLSGIATFVIPDARLAAAMPLMHEGGEGDVAAKILVTARGYEPFEKTDVPVHKGQDNRVEVALKTTQVGVTRVLITVTDAATQKPLPAALIALDSAGPGSPLRMFTDEQGKATLVLPEVREDMGKPERPATLTVTLRNYEQHIQTLALKRGQDNPVVVAMKPIPVWGVTKIAITVTSAVSKEPVMGATVELRLTGRSPLKTLTDASGVATMVVPDSILADNGDKPATLIVTMRGYETSKNEAVKLVPKQDNAIAVALKPVPTPGITKVIVTVTDKVTQAAVASALVELEPKQAGMTMRAFTDATGKAELVLSETQAMSLQADDAAARTMKLTVTARGYNRYVKKGITLTPGATNELAVALEPLPTGTITKVTAKVLHETSKAPVIGATVDMRLSDGKAMRAFTDTQGMATFVVLDTPSSEVGTRTAKFTVTHRDFQTAVKEGVSVERGKETAVEILLKPKTSGGEYPPALGFELTVDKMQVIVGGTATLTATVKTPQGTAPAGNRVRITMHDSGQTSTLCERTDNPVVCPWVGSGAVGRSVWFEAEFVDYPTLPKSASISVAVVPPEQAGNAALRQSLALNVDVSASNGRIVDLPPVVPPDIEITPTSIKIPAFTYTVPKGTQAGDGSVVDEDFTISVPEIVIPIENGVIKFPGVTVTIPDMKLKKSDGTVETIPGRTITVPPREIPLPGGLPVTP
jgi:hypothetical protein